MNMVIPIQLIDFIIMFFASIFPLSLGFAARRAHPTLFSLMLLLGLMALVHSFFHLSLFLGYTSTAPLIEFSSVVILVAFGAILLIEDP